MNLLITAFDSTNPDVINSLSHFNAAFSKIFICFKNSHSAKLSLIANSQIRAFDTESVFYDEPEKLLNYIAKTDLCAQADSLARINSHFSNNQAILLQSERLLSISKNRSISYTHLYSVYLHWVNYLVDNNISTVIFSQDPHTGSDYLLLLAVQALQLRYISFRALANSNIHTLFTSSKAESVSLSLPFSYPSSPSPFDLYVGKLLCSLKVERPSNLHQYNTDPRAFSNALRSTLDHSHSRLSSKYTLRQDSFMYFLHCEPELAVNPNGYPFLQQSTAITFLTALLPPDIHLFIKDHPHLRRRLQIDKCYQALSRSFRKSLYPFLIGNLQNVSYIGQGQDAFTLLAGGHVPVTMTGDICIESLLYGLPVLCLSEFWPQRLQGQSGLLTVSNVQAAFQTGDFTELLLSSVSEHHQYESLRKRLSPQIVSQPFYAGGSQSLLSKSEEQEYLSSQANMFCKAIVEHLKA